MQSKISSSLSECKWSISIEFGIGWGMGIDECMAFLLLCFLVLVAASAFSICSRISGVAMMVSLCRMWCFPDCHRFRVVIIFCRSESCCAWMRFLAKLRLRVLTIRTTWVRSGVLKMAERSFARCWMQVLAACISGVAIRDDVKSALYNGVSYSSITWRIRGSIVARGGTRERTFSGLDGRRPVPDHPLQMFHVVKAKGRATTKASSHSAFWIRGIPVQIYRSISRDICTFMELKTPTSSGWVKCEVCGGSSPSWIRFRIQWGQYWLSYGFHGHRKLEDESFHSLWHWCGAQSLPITTFWYAHYLSNPQY